GRGSLTRTEWHGACVKVLNLRRIDTIFGTFPQIDSLLIAEKTSLKQSKELLSRRRVCYFWDALGSVNGKSDGFSPGRRRGSRPKCSKARRVAMRPRDVRFRKPICIRYGSIISSIESFSSWIE